MKKLKFYLRRIYRLTLNFQKQEEIVWKELKKLHEKADWKAGVYEKEKYIETVFEISTERMGVYYYMIYEGCFHCRVKVLDHYTPDITTELFVLAAHFNNLLTDGVVIVHVQGQYVEFHQKREILIPLLYDSEIYGQLIRHFNTSKDIYSAFQRLVLEREAPAIIIADLIKKNERDAEKKD